MITLRVSQALQTEPDSRVHIGGWIKTARQAGSSTKAWLFLEVNDGSDCDNLQVILPEQVVTYHGLSLKNFMLTGTCVQLRGNIVKAPAKAKQKVEMQCDEILYVAASDADYPFAKKQHTLEFLRDRLHLRSRTSVLSAIMRVRHQLALATHEFFSSNGFYHVTTPILTLKDVETAGETFDVTSKNKSLSAKLTVSGQIHAEYMALGLGRVYTFGPTFRAENSHTSRHLSEFWMVEPEAIFTDLQETMSLIEDYIRFCAKKVLSKCAKELESLKLCTDSSAAESFPQHPFTRISYDQAQLLINSAVCTNQLEGRPLKIGDDLGSHHEQYLTRHYAGPVFVYDWPSSTKPFYMRQNADSTCAAVDLLVPNVGELVGGGQREERFEILSQNLQKHGLSDPEYLSTRRWGSAPHSGFGVGFDRLVMYLTGMQNIRDVIPFPRWAGSCQS